MIGERLFHAVENPVEEDHRGGIAGGTCFADRIHERQFGAAIGRQVLDQNDPLAFGHHPFDPGVAAVSFGFLPHIGHGQRQPFGDHSPERDACRFPACDVVEGFKPGFTHDRDTQEIHQRRADPRERDDLAAINVGGCLLAGCMGEGFFGIEGNRPDFQQHPGGQSCDFFLCRE